MSSPLHKAQPTSLKIGFDAKRLLAGSGGLQSYARTLLLTLLKYHPDHQYYLYTPEVKDQRVLAELLAFEQVKLRQPSGLSAAHWRTKSIVKDLINDEVNIYHGLSGELPIGINSAGIKAAVTIHDMLWQKFPEDYNFIDRKINDWKLEGAISRADAIISVSEYTKQKLNSTDSDTQVKVINPVVAPEFYEAADRHERDFLSAKYGINDPYILAIGNAKGRKYISEFFRAVRPVLGDIDCLLIGQNNGNTNDLKVLSDVAYQDMPAIYRSAIACIYPSLGEGFGLPILESIKSNIPVVVQDSPPMNAFDSPLCLSCEVTDTASAQEAMRRALNLGSESKALQRPSIRELQQYADAYMNTYQELLR